MNTFNGMRRNSIVKPQFYGEMQTMIAKPLGNNKMEVDTIDVRNINGIIRKKNTHRIVSIMNKPSSCGQPYRNAPHNKTVRFTNDRMERMSPVSNTNVFDRMPTPFSDSIVLVKRRPKSVRKHRKKLNNGTHSKKTAIKRTPSPDQKSTISNKKRV